MSYSDYVETAWTPDVIGPIYKKENTNLREVSLFLFLHLISYPRMTFEQNN